MSADRDAGLLDSEVSAGLRAGDLSVLHTLLDRHYALTVCFVRALAPDADAARMLPIELRSFPMPPGYSLKLFEDARIGPNLRPLKQHVVGDVAKVLWVLMGGIGLVLLIACANVANLLPVRAEGRQQ